MDLERGYWPVVVVRKSGVLKRHPYKVRIPPDRWEEIDWPLLAIAAASEMHASLEKAGL